MDLDYFHEVEVVVLRSDTKRPCASLWKLHKEQGFTLDDDVFSLDRPDRPPISLWQTRSVISVHIFNGDSEVYNPGGQWNRVVLKYLLATQPRSGIAIFSKRSAEISARLSLPMLFKGRVVTHDELSNHLDGIADELTVQIGEPGSEDVAIVVESTYPRRRT